MTAERDVTSDRSDNAIHPPGTLYVVATPIGNVADLSPRAIDVLRSVDTVLCEDTRRTRRLFERIGIKVRLESHHEHNEVRDVTRHVDALLGGVSLALVSDAGTPEISDPGFPLVRSASAAGVPIVAVPGPSAVTAALGVAGLPTDRFVFLGYLPLRAARRRALLESVSSLAMTLVVFEAPHRIGRTLGVLAGALGDRPAALCRELTKRHEEVMRGTLRELEDLLAAREPKGEVTLVVAGAASPRRARADVAFTGAAREMFERLVAGGVGEEEARQRTRALFG